METTGDRYAAIFEKELNAKIQEKFDNTNSVAKWTVGIKILDDAKNKGYAPTDKQIDAIAAEVKKITDEKYADPEFLKKSDKDAAKELSAAIGKRVAEMNEGWKKEGKYAFSNDDLALMNKEALQVVEKENKKEVQVAQQNMKQEEKQSPPAPEKQMAQTAPAPDNTGKPMDNNTPQASKTPQGELPPIDEIVAQNKAAMEKEIMEMRRKNPEAPEVQALLSREMKNAQSAQMQPGEQQPPERKISQTEARTNSPMTDAAQPDMQAISQGVAAAGTAIRNVGQTVSGIANGIPGLEGLGQTIENAANSLAQMGEQTFGNIQQQLAAMRSEGMLKNAGEMMSNMTQAGSENKVAANTKIDAPSKGSGMGFS